MARTTKAAVSIRNSTTSVHVISLNSFSSAPLNTKVDPYGNGLRRNVYPLKSPTYKLENWKRSNLVKS